MCFIWPGWSWEDLNLFLVIVFMVFNRRLSFFFLVFEVNVHGGGKFANIKTKKCFCVIKKHKK